MDQIPYKDGWGNPIQDGFYVQRDGEQGVIAGEFPYYNQIVFIHAESKMVEYSDGRKEKLVLWDGTANPTPRPDEFEPIDPRRIAQVVAFRKEDINNLERLVKKHQKSS